MSKFVDTPDLAHVRQRISRLAAQGLQPMEIIMSAGTWATLREQYRKALPGLAPKTVSAREVFGVRSKLVSGTQGCVIRYFGGMDFPLDQAIIDGFVDRNMMQPPLATSGGAQPDRVE